MEPIGLLLQFLNLCPKFNSFYKIIRMQKLPNLLDLTGCIENSKNKMPISIRFSLGKQDISANSEYFMAVSDKNLRGISKEKPVKYKLVVANAETLDNKHVMVEKEFKIPWE